MNSSLSSKSDKFSTSKFFSSFSTKIFDSSNSNCNIFWKLYNIISVSCLSKILVLSFIFDLYINFNNLYEFSNFFSEFDFSSKANCWKIIIYLIKYESEKLLINIVKICLSSFDAFWFMKISIKIDI